MLSLICLLLILPPDSNRTTISYGILPDGFWSPSYGLGIGLYLSIDPFPPPRTRTNLRMYLNQRRQALYVTLTPKHAHRLSPQHTITGLYRIHFFAENNLVRGFHGTGAATSRDIRIRFHHIRLLNQTFLTRLAFSPFTFSIFIRLFYDRILDYRVLPKHISTLPRSITEQLSLVTQRYTHFFQTAAGFSIDWEHLSHPHTLPEGWLFSTGVLYQRDINIPDISFYRIFIGFYHTPYTSDTFFSFAYRILFSQTRPLGSTPIPFLYLPVLDYYLLPGYDRYRLVGHDAFILSMEGQFPLKNLLHLYQLNGYIQGGIGNVYQNFWKEFMPGVTFRKMLHPSENRFPLRPGIGVGIRIIDTEDGGILLDALWGISPESISFVMGRFIFKLSDHHPSIF